VTTPALFDVVTGTPNNPLTVASSTGELQIFFSGSNTLVPVVPGGQPDGIGEGALSLLFDGDHTEFGLTILGNSISGEVTFQFFDRTGASVGTETVVTTSVNPDFTLSSDAGAFAGVTITNTDPAGVTYDNFRLGDVVQTGPATPVPALSPWSLFILVFVIFLLSLVYFRRATV
jgi:hypothetical protein